MSPIGCAYSRSFCIVRGSVPFMCMRTAPAPIAATAGSIAGSKRPAVTSLTRSAPASTAARATAALRVSIDRGAVERSRIPAITGTTRAISSSQESSAAGP